MPTDSKTEAPTKRAGGVADYFAILGVGEKLLWKHSQKQSHDGSHNTDEEEDEAALMERFYREIVEVTILMNDGESPTPLRPSQSYESSSHSSSSHPTITTTSNQPKTMSTKYHIPVPLPTSPIPSESTATITAHESVLERAGLSQSEIDGYTSVTTTIPAGRPSLRYGDTHLWNKSQVFDANLDPCFGFRQELLAKMADSTNAESHDPLRGIGRKVGSTLRNQLVPMMDRFRDKQRAGNQASDPDMKKFHLGFRRRLPDEVDRPALADLTVHYIRLHRETLLGRNKIPDSASVTTSDSTTTALKRGLATGAVIAARVAEAGKQKFMQQYRGDSSRPEQQKSPVFAQKHFFPDRNDGLVVPLHEVLTLPDGFDEWSIPEDYQWIKFPSAKESRGSMNSLTGRHAIRSEQSRIRKTFLVPHKGDNPLERTPSDDNTQASEPSGAGIEAYLDSSSYLPSPPSSATGASERKWTNRPLSPGFPREELLPDSALHRLEPGEYIPRILSEPLPTFAHMVSSEDYCFIPVLAIRRQRVGDEQRYLEDPAIVELAVTFDDGSGIPVMPRVLEGFDDEDDDECHVNILGRSEWLPSSINTSLREGDSRPSSLALGSPIILVKRNNPIGFADAAFATRVLDRFPVKNYKDLPLPEEELPMFCYPTGCRLHRARYCDAPLPQYYGFVVKNERGHSIYVSCVSFMEPLTSAKIDQLAAISQRRRRVSLPHRRFCQRKERSKAISTISAKHPAAFTRFTDHWENDDDDDDELLTGFDDMVTFENKTICLISRHPFWTAFRRFLSHLHILSGSSSDLPLERCISHLLLTVPLPKPGGPCVMVPLPALNGQMVLSFPPTKDLPLVDLPYHRLLACLDVPTIVTIVLGFLALERKLIIMSTRPSLVLDVCELLKSLLFPFDLCAPYVPRLTQPFMSCLEFPGAIFVGIHDDKTPDGLAAIVRESLPEDSAIVDLDTGEIDCSGDRHQVLKHCWGVVPSGPRSMLVSEIETLCRDAGIVPGQEPLDSQIDSAFETVLSSNVVDDMDDRRGNTEHEPLDDRAVRDSFVRFFCSVLGGYERYLVVPDVDFMTSGIEWFDTQGFLAEVPSDRAAFLGSLVNTQLFQSFVQRRTEASDVHCLLFDDCLAEYHSSPIPFGRLGGDVETMESPDEGQPQMLYSLLVDQCSAEAFQAPSDEGETKAVYPAGSGSSEGHEFPWGHGVAGANTELIPTDTPDFYTNSNGDLITTPSRLDLVDRARFVYCIDGNPCFPHKLSTTYFLPREPDSLLVEISEAPLPLLARSEREVDEAQRRRKISTTYRGLRNQRRCLWQLPKLMGSHFLGTWLMCIPSQVSQAEINEEDQTRFLLRALGALRLLRHRQRIIPDEASYRALMVACGRINSDRRTELVKLFGLLRSDAIFPSAVTLGQYTRALAEGYNKRSTGIPEIDHSGGGVEVTVSLSHAGTEKSGRRSITDFVGALNALDSNLGVLEDSGRRWRHRGPQPRENGPINQLSEKGEMNSRVAMKGSIDTPSLVSSTTSVRKAAKKKSPEKNSWLPVVLSSSFVPTPTKRDLPTNCMAWKESTKLIAMWSRTSACDQCSYLPLDEEIQSGWDVIEGDNVTGAIDCPRCGAMIIPKLGYKAMSLQEAYEIENYVGHQGVNKSGPEDFETEILPPQIRMSIDAKEPDFEVRPNAGYVTYISPAALRSALEKYVDEKGESVLDRETLKSLDPEVFYNFWWYCSRFSLPLPLPIKIPDETIAGYPYHACALASWDQAIAERGCKTAAINIYRHLGWTEPALQESSDHLEEIGEMHDELPLLARFNLQALSHSDWDHKDLSEILVTLVGACDKRNFRPVLECALRCNKRRKEEAEVDSIKQDISSYEISASADATNESSEMANFSDSVELDCYRTILYLAKYQCTTAFHVFFPATTKACKGYHFWCAFGTPMPIFDRLFREAVKEIRGKDSSFIPVHDVSDVALGFRCVFGHII